MNSIEYKLSFEDYKKRPGVSKSILESFRECPLKAYEIQQGLIQDKQTDAMLMGTLIDAAIFEPKRLPELFHAEPDSYENEKGEVKPWNNNATVCKKWNAEHADKPIIDRRQLQSVQRMMRAVWDEPQAVELLQGARFQVSIFAEHRKTGLQLKGRPDGMGPGYMLDLKKVRDASTSALSKAIAEYHYYVQAAYYADLAEANGISVPDFYFIAVEESERPKVNVRLLRGRAIELGRFVYQRDLVTFAECVKTGIWPGYCEPGKVGYVDVSDWEETKVMDSLPLLNVEEAA